MALQDVQQKDFDAAAAYAEYLSCLVVKSSCDNERRNFDSKLHDFEVAYNALKYACPWLAGIIG
jgi:hypothetical protein